MNFIKRLKKTIYVEYSPVFKIHYIYTKKRVFRIPKLIIFLKTIFLKKYKELSKKLDYTHRCFVKIKENVLLAVDIDSET